MGSRYLPIAGGSLIITFGLLFAMQALIAIDEIELPEVTNIFTVDFIHPIEETELQVKDRVPERPKPPAEPPPVHDFPAPRQGGDTIVVGLQPIAPEPVDDDEFRITRESDAVPVVRVAPEYPPRMAARGVEGWVELMFDVGRSGEVVDPRVTASSHPGFERAALRAVRGWRYNPKLEDGRAVMRRGIRVRLAFSLDQART